MDIQNETRKLLKGCVILSDSGVRLYTPDGQGNYPALWTRDFAYMVEYAGDLIPMDDIRSGIEYLIGGMRADGWVPDRVYKDGVAMYTAGDKHFPASPNLDNGCFLCLLADAYLCRLPHEEAVRQFAAWEHALCRGVDCLPTDENGLIVNVATPPHSPYGFTDTVCKTGGLCMESLLLWRAKRALVAWKRAVGADATAYERDLRGMEEAFGGMFLQSDGTLRAATDCCAQTDVWAMCYALSIGFPLPEAVQDGMADWLVVHYDSLTESGQLRHLPAGEYWEKTFVPVAQGTYQNGAYWATPVKWLCDALARRDRRPAEQAREQVAAYFETHGIYECVNGEDRKLSTYVVSAAALYAAYK